jgi:Saxitoxin biosynthesis operon protein SxtJ
LSYSSPFDDSALPSERKFGVLFTFVFGLLAAYGAWKAWSSAVVGAGVALSVLLGLATLIKPTVLAPLNRAWFALGLLLGRIVSPIVLGVMFFGLITPMAVVARLFGRDELRLKPRQASSYWRDRLDATPATESFKNQF